MKLSASARISCFLSAVVLICSCSRAIDSTVSTDTSSSLASQECMGLQGPLAVNNAEVEKWEQTSKNQFHARGHIQGAITEVFHDQTGHKHFSVALSASNKSVVEVIYNQSFGELPSLSAGMEVEACGDYITDRSSPERGILHWVHRSDTESHPSGFVAINGTLYGQESGTGN